MHLPSVMFSRNLWVSWSLEHSAKDLLNNFGPFHGSKLVWATLKKQCCHSLAKFGDGIWETDENLGCRGLWILYQGSSYPLKNIEERGLLSAIPRAES